MNPTRRASQRSKPGAVIRAPQRQRTPEERADLLALFAQSGQSAAAFCREMGLGEQTFYTWRRKARAQGSSALQSRPGFAEVAVRPAGFMAPAEGIRVYFGEQCRLELPVTTAAAWLLQILNGVQPAP
jgi:transposase-like protein